MTKATLQPPIPYASLLAITGDENVLVLVPGPGEESMGCGGFIAESCRRGRPPFVMVLGDGTGAHPNSAKHPPDHLANLCDRETRAAVACLGLSHERLLMAGVYDGQIPTDGAGFDAVVRGVTLVMWARDCNVICAPWPDPDDEGGRGATWRIARAVASSSGVGLLAYVEEGAVPNGMAGSGWRLDIAGQLGVKRAAVAAHASQLGQVMRGNPTPRLFDPNEATCGRPYEVFIQPAAD